MATIIVAQSAGEPRETLAKGLRTRGFEVGVFDDIDGALEAASGTPINALLVDPGLLLQEDMALSPRLQVRAGRQVRLLVLVERANPEVARKFREHGADLLVRPPQDVDRLAKTLHASAPDAPWEPQVETAAAPASAGPVGTYSQSQPLKRKRKKKAEPIVERTRATPAAAPPAPSAPLFAPPPAIPPPAPWPSAPPPPPAWPTAPAPAPPWQAKGPAWTPAAPPPPATAPPPPPAPLLLVDPLPEEEPVRRPEPTRQSPPPRAGLNADELFADAEEEPTHEVGAETGSRSDILSPPVSAASDDRDGVEPGGLADALEPEPEEEETPLERELFGDRDEERTSQVEGKTAVGPTAVLPTTPEPPARARMPEPPPPPVVEVEEEEEERFSLAELTGGVIPSILVVDDDPAFRGFLRDALTEQGFRVHTAINAPNALRFIKSGIAVDMVISDLSMPHMDGFELKHEIDKWARDERKPMPFIIVTGGASETQVQTAAQVKVAAVVAKPIEDMDAFFAIVIDTLRGAGVISQNA